MKVPSIKTFGRRCLALVQQRNVASGVAVALLSTMVVVAAVQADGTKATNVQLDDGAVWVSNQNQQLVGRLNIRVDELDLAVQAGATADVLQQGRDVAFTGGLGGVQRIDVVTGEPSGKNTVDFPDYQMNGGIATVFDRATGHLWVGSSGVLVGSEFPKKPDAWLEAGSRVVLTAADDEGANARGKVFVVGPTSFYELELDASFKPVREPQPEAAATDDSTAVTTTELALATDGTVADGEPEPIKTPDVRSLAHAVGETTAVTAVGDRLVFLGEDGSLFSTDGDVAQVPGEGAVLQQAGPRNGSVLVASSTGLFEVSIGSGSVKQLAGANGVPARPVRVGPCVFGAWSGDEPSWFKACNGDVLVPVSPIPKAAPDSVLVYRVNQRNVAINSIGDGGVWADHDGVLAQAGSWEDTKADDLKLDEPNPGDTTRQADKQCAYDGSGAPEANDDELGMRPRQSIIDVLYNDDDPNCEPLAIAADSLTPASGEWGQLTVINNGQHVLLSPSQSLLEGAASGRVTVEFSYVIEDSTGNRSEPAQVTLAVYDVSVGNAAPALRPKRDGTTRTMSTVLEEGRMVTYDVTSDWWDADGDDMLLTSAIPERGEVSSTPDGVVRYGAYGVPAGLQNVAITMSDGKASATEQLEVTVKPNGAPIPPFTSDDFITLVEGATGVLFPLANDSDPNEDTLTLVPKWSNEVPGYSVKTVQGDALEITGVTAGVYSLEYEASDDEDSTRGTIRLVVLKPDGTNRAPIAVPDQVKLRPDRVVNVDVLSNDVDPDGDVLAITDVRATTDTAGGVIRASIIDRRLVQIEVVPGPDGTTPTGPFLVYYVIADGRGAERAATQDQAENDADSRRTEGVITVTVVPAIVDQPPVPGADEVVVRSGDVVAVPVLVNDIDPDGDPLMISGLAVDQAAQLEAAGSVIAWVSGRNVFVKGGTPGPYTLQYSVLANGQPASAVIDIRVTPPPDLTSNPNNPPEPKPLVLRAVRNATVRLLVPTFGIDRDGDSIALLPTFGGLQGAAQGNVVQVDPLNANVILFTAGQTSGPSDEFSYSVRDPYNGVGTEVITVVVVDNDGWSPQAHDDVRRAKPGRTITVPLLANDTSPQDSALVLAENPFLDAAGEETATPMHPDAVNVLDQSDPDLHGRIEVVVPADGSTLIEHYRIEDSVGNPSQAFLRVTPDPDAPNLAPIAGPDVVESAEIADVDVVTVDVLKNDFDQDDTQPLTVTVPFGENASAADGKVAVPVEDFAQLVLYRLEDSEGASTIGIIRVPGRENHRPVLTEVGEDPTAREIPADATEPITILLADIVEDPDGDSPVLLTTTEVKVVGGQGTVRRLPGDVGFTYLPPGSAEQPIQVTIQFEVTDRPQFSLDQQQDPTCNCVAALPVVVSVTASSAPRVLSQGNVAVPQLDEEVVFDLAPLVIDDQGDELDFVLLDPAAGGLDIVQVGSKITLVSTKGALVVGTQIRVDFTVSDRNFPPVPNSVLVTISDTNTPPPFAASFPVQNAERDTAFDLPNVITPATNPFPERPLKLVNSSVDGTGASVTCTSTGDCQFTSTTVGTFTVSYTLQDVLNPPRSAPGTITVLVKGKPRAPGVPRIVSVGDKVVNLQWTPADMQGGAFTTYWVTEDVTGTKMQFTDTGGPFPGLKNATTYRFTVLAENEMGMGESSLPSSTAVPDRVPDPPISLSFTDYGDRTLYLSWMPPSTTADFTPINLYQVSIGGQTLTTTGTTLTVSNLANGTDYSFKVRARNSATTNGGWGEWEDPGLSVLSERPSTFPNPPTNVVAVNSGDGGTPRLTVTWSAPLNDGGRPISSYRVCVLGSTTNCQTPVGLSATFAASRGQSLRFTVVAYNTDGRHRNNSDASVASPATSAVGNPDVPVISSISSGDKNLVVNASSTNNSGCSSYFLEYSRNGGSSWQTSNSFGGLVNGTSYTFIVRAVLPGTCGTAGTTYRSGNSSSVAQTPYGPLVQPTMNASLSGNRITWTWSTNRADDGRPGWSASVTGECAGQSSGYSYDFGYSSGPRTCTITISAPGQVSRVASDGASTPAPPSPSIILSTPASGTRWINISGSNFPPGARFYFICSDSGGQFANSQTGLGSSNGFTARYVDSNGNISITSGQGCFNAAVGATTVHVYTVSPAASAPDRTI